MYQSNTSPVLKLFIIYPSAIVSERYPGLATHENVFNHLFTFCVGIERDRYMLVIQGPNGNSTKNEIYETYFRALICASSEGNEAANENYIQVYDNVEDFTVPDCLQLTANVLICLS